MNIKRKDKEKINRIIRAAALRAGVKREEVKKIQDTIWEVRVIVSNDRDGGYVKAAMSVAADIGPKYALAAIRRLTEMGVVQDGDYEKIKNLIEKKYSKEISGSERIYRAFNQAANAVSESGYGLLGPSASKGRTVGANSIDKSARPESSQENINDKKTVNKANSRLARDYYKSIGISDSVRSELLPVTGYVVHKDHIKKKKQSVLDAGAGNAEGNAIFELGDEDVVGDGLTAHGEIEIVLKPGVSNRVAYGMGNGIKTGVKPVKLNSTNKEDVADALTSIDGANGEQESLEMMINLLASSVDNDYSDLNASFDDNGKMRKVGTFDSAKRKRKPLEAQILGGFDVEEIEQVNYPFSKLTKQSINEPIDDVVNQKFIVDILGSSGFNPEEIEYITSTGIDSKINTASMQMLKNYRYAQKIKKKFADGGVKKLKIAHPSGIDIEDPMSHSKAAKPGQKVEEVLLENIRREVKEAAEKMIKDMRKPGTPSLVSRRRGGML